MTRHRGAHLDNSVNIPMVFSLLLLWTLHHYFILRSNPLPARHNRGQIAKNAAVTCFGLVSYIYIQEEVGPYWVWHSGWHLGASTLSRFVLETNDANSQLRHRKVLV